VSNYQAGESEAAQVAPSVPVPAVQLSNITKRFGSVVACDQVDLDLYQGQIHGLLGENGAGKSTLMKILIGLVVPDGGSIKINGVEAPTFDPQSAAGLGIAMVHQDFSLVEPLTVWENVALGERGSLRPAAVRERVGEISERYGLPIDPDATVSGLGAGMRQRVEIIKCLRRDPSILIFDEPTSVLTPEESAQLFQSLRRDVAAEGRAVVLVSHKLDEVLAATDKVTVMRQGAVVARETTSETDAPALARAMVGRKVSLRSERGAFGSFDPRGSNSEARGESQSPTRTVDQAEVEPVLRIEGASISGASGNVLLDGLNLDLYPGQVVGVAGVEGNGQRALADLLSGLMPLKEGTVLVDGNPVPTGRPGAMSRAGIAVVPEDRSDSGAATQMSVAENLILVDQGRFASRGVIDRGAVDQFARQMIADFDIQCSGPDAPLWTLSGGNQQRVVLARELAGEPRVLVAAQPTAGLDVGAIEYIEERLRQAARAGVAVLLISSELEEILGLADRVVVMHAGRIVGQWRRDEVDLEQLGLLMGGV